jgi:hypothetical protein
VENVYTFKKPYKEIISNIIIMNISNRSYSCNICNKKYKSYKSLWNHNNKFHKIHNQKPITKQQLEIQQLEQQPISDSKHICRYCNRSFNHYNNKWRHQKICKQKLDKQKQIELENRTNKTTKSSRR